MGNKGGFMRIAVTAAVCISVLSYAVYSFLFVSNEAPSGTEFYPVASFEKVNTGNKTSATPQVETASSQPSSETAVAAASSGTVKGNIIEKFISPYTAKDSYNGVYLKNSTDLDINIKELLNSPLGYKIEKNGEPQVLIMHTHTTESFMTELRDTYTDADNTRTTDESLNMVALGNIIADTLNKNGISTVHDTTVHDFPEYNGSYSRAAKTITSNIKKYPSIKIVIDVHRDSISAEDTDKVKVTTEIQGKKAAQVMLVMGSQSGGVTNFPNWQENLKLAVRLQQTIEGMYPSLARSLSLMPKNYNESLTKGSLLLEIGTDANTVDEVRYSAELVGNALKNLLDTL